MTWPRAFLPVPTASLTVDPQVAKRTDKATPDDLSRWMRDVPEIYERLEHGATDADFRRMMDAPADAHERELADTYRHLFSTSPSAQPLRAEVDDGGRLQVVAGQHRVRAAQRDGVPLLPVHVAAPDEPTLDAVRQEVEDRTRSLDPAAVELHRRYDEHFRDERERPQTPTRAER
jgi:hypothetical protein